MAEVVLDKVRKVYPGPVVAVDEMDLHVEDGEFVVLVGPSGCGKTTALRMIAGLEELTSGAIRIGGRVVNAVPPKDRDVAMVFQDYALYPHMSVSRIMAFGLKLRKIPKAQIEERVKRTAELLGIVDLLDRRPASLSGGQQQRVALGRAIVRNPACYLFDEPLSNLDAKLRTQMRSELKALHLRLKTTTIYVTHDQEEAMTLADRVAVMSGGVLRQVGTPLEVYRRPVNRFVAGFLGTPPMNFLDGRIERSNGKLWFTDSSTVRLSIGEDGALEVSEMVGRPVVLGIRPQQLQCAGDGVRTAEEQVVRVHVEVTELLGDQMDVFARTTAGARVVARVRAGADCAAGQDAEFKVATSAMHLFEPGEFGRHVGLSIPKSLNC